MKTDILAVNPGSTSTKVGVFRCQEDGSLSELFMETINHNPNHLLQYESLEAQQPYRREVIESVLNDKGYDMGNLRAVVGRGGQLQGLKSGGYRVDPNFCRDMMSPKNVQHASNLGAPLAYSLAEPLGIPSFIYDSTRGCELSDVARVSGLEGLVRYGNCHVLNSRAQAIRYARSVGKEYEDMHIIVCHMGGGITVSAHEEGRIIDDSSYDEGPMSPERTGGIQLTTWTELCCSGKYTEAELKKIICGKGGLYSYLGVTDCRQVEKMIEEGNQRAAVVYEAMAYQVAKSIAAMTIPLKGKVDAILLTGGAAHSKMLTGMIQEYAGHLGKFVLMPGENELEALAEGAWRILEGKEKANTYQG
ncbi:MAG: butyrate kinase [Anaerovoracaceae bacterium]